MRIRLRPAAIEAAHKEHDTLYIFELQDDTGICVIPGKRFRSEGRPVYILPRAMYETVFSLARVGHGPTS